MAHIVSFSVTGLAGRHDTITHTLDDDVNVFFGLNGSGKTSLLKVLVSALTADAELLRRVAFQSAEVKIYSSQWNSVFTHRLKSSDLLSRGRIVTRSGFLRSG